MEDIVELQRLRRLWKDNPVSPTKVGQDVSEKKLMEESKLARLIIDDLRTTSANLGKFMARAENLSPTDPDLKAEFDNEMNNAYSRIYELSEKLTDIEGVVEKKKTAFLEMVRNEKSCEERVKTLIRNAKILENLKGCRINCEHRAGLKAIINNGNGQSARKDFHFFLCYEHRLLGRDGESVIQAHKTVIDEWGFSWWGKCIGERSDNGEFYPIEPLGESMSAATDAFLARTIQERVRERIRNQKRVYLYLYDPNPPNYKLHKCTILDFWYGEGKIPHGDEFAQAPPQCAHFPGYYFEKREKMCRTCTKVEPSRCIPKFLSNFWFKLERIESVSDMNLEFACLRNAFTEAPVNFARPILYPLLITHSE
ncbi:MAG: hypothetical protein C4576_13475 [Desulfobacteraceae bacterium]|nr:MAG: hypothetical protein C4576_13475 [Desulfobacteraceae bacterium]